MPLGPDEIDLDATLRSLEQTFELTPEERQPALRLAIDALLFLHAENRLHEFRGYLRTAHLPAQDVIRVEREFADLAQATRWLSATPPPRHGTLVKVAGRTHTVWRDEDGSLLLLPSFSPQELEERRKK